MADERADGASADAGSTHEETVGLLGQLAQSALHLWDIPTGASSRLINLSENATYLVEGEGGYRSVLRVHREGYHSVDAIRSELAWMRDLSASGGVVTAPPIAGRDGNLIQSASHPGLPRPRNMVLFEFVDGEEPNEDLDLVGPFRELGEIAARTHVHSIRWERPPYFERLDWAEESVFGERLLWGDWRAAPEMDGPARAVLERQQAVILRRLEAFGKAEGRFGLIHADMRLANLLIHEGATRLIDFDDCGTGWFMYDFATGVSFIEDHPKVPELRAAWVEGYRTVRDLPEEDVREIDTFVMFRRMALLAWIGSHSETDLAREQGPEFTRVSVELAERYLSEFG